MKENNDEKETILKSLAPLFEKAEREGLVFFNYRARYFTPLELRNKHRVGEYIWGPTNWKLVPHTKRTAVLMEDVDEALAKKEDWIARVAKWRGTNNEE